MTNRTEADRLWDEVNAAEDKGIEARRAAWNAWASHAEPFDQLIKRLSESK